MRKLEDVQKEYIAACQAAGDMAYRIECFKAELQKLMDKMVELNKEANTLAEEAKKEDTDGQQAVS